MKMSHSPSKVLILKNLKQLVSFKYLVAASSFLSILFSNIQIVSAQPKPGDRTNPSNGELEYVLDRVETANQAYKGFSKRADCVDCSKTRYNLKYQACSDKNNYLENEISLAKNTTQHPLYSILNKDKITTGLLKPECIQLGMVAKFSEKSKSFRECSDQSSAAGKAVYRPCISENYFNLINNSFQTVSQCMKGFINPEASPNDQKLDVRAVYALINIESGFHVNAMSGTGAGGIGQFTQSAIDDVNKNQFSKIKQSLNASEDLKCQELANNVLDRPMAASRKNSCERISLKNGNPAKNMIYTFAYMSTAKKILDRAIFSHKSYSHKFRHLSNPELNKIKRALMVWSHNAGPGGTITPAISLLNSVYRNTKIPNADSFIRAMQNAMKMAPARANSTPARRAETSRYFPAITSTLNTIENSIGGGTCLN